MSQDIYYMISGRQVKTEINCNIEIGATTAPGVGILEPKIDLTFTWQY